MKLSQILIVLLMFSAITAHARDSVHKYGIDEALNLKKAEGVVDPNVKLFWGDSKYPKVSTRMVVVNANKKTRAFGRSDRVACMWVFLSAVKHLQKRARDMGADAVVNIKSTYKGRSLTSSEMYECGAGALIAGVSLTGEIVRLKK